MKLVDDALVDEKPIRNHKSGMLDDVISKCYNDLRFEDS